MKQFLALILLAGLSACDNSSEIQSELDTTKKKLDTLVNRVENSEVVDSIKSKGGKLLDSVKSKGGRLMDKVEEKADDRKDTIQ